MSSPDVRGALRAVRTWRLGRGFQPSEGSWYRRLTPIELLQMLRYLTHELYGWDGVEGTALVLYYGLDVAIPCSEATAGQILARRAGQAGRQAQPVSVATVRRYLRTAESGLAHAMMSHSGLEPSERDRSTATDPRVDDAAYTVLASALPLPPWGALERRLAQGLLDIAAPLPARTGGRSTAKRAERSRARRTAEANLAVVRAVLTVTDTHWRQRLPPTEQTYNEEPQSPVDVALRGGNLLRSYEGLLELCRQALIDNGPLALHWLRRAKGVRHELGDMVATGHGARLHTMEHWYRGQLAFDYRDISSLGPRPGPGNPRLRMLTPLGRSNGFRTSNIHASMIYEVRVLLAHDLFTEAIASVERRRRELHRADEIREPDADSTPAARLKSRLMANQNELEILVAQLEQQDGAPQTGTTAELFRRGEALVESIVEDALELVDDFGYSHFAAITTRLYTATATRATTARRRERLLSAASEVLDRERLFEPCPCGCTVISNGAALRLTIAQRDLTSTVKLLTTALKQAQQKKYFDGDTLDLVQLHRRASDLGDVQPVDGLDLKLLRPRPGSPRQHHAAWLHLASTTTDSRG